MLAIPDFVPHASVPAATVEAYDGLVPEEIVDLWERYGYGSFGEGFVRVIDPHAYEMRIGNLLGKMIGEGSAVPIMVTALADVILWEPDRGVAGLLLRQRRAVGLGSPPRPFVRLNAKHRAAHHARALDSATALIGRSSPTATTPIPGRRRPPSPTATARTIPTPPPA